ncbi:MAG: GerMN domain-containing protein [Patescibacteria group bacterium]|nr:GerMN domain-containing protein [Patescibacteria group bacterium]
MAFLKTKLFWQVIVIILLIAVAILGIRFLSGPEDTWLCQDGQWVKHGNPGAAMPIAACGERKQTGEISVAMPQPNQTISSPLIVEGLAIGNWYFEASFPIELIDGQGKILSQSHVQAQSDWMTENLVPFKGEINYQAAATTIGKLVFKNDNPSGLSQNEKKFEIPVVISPSQTMSVKAFFNNNNLDPEVSCNKVFAVERPAPKTAAVAGAALEQLLAGPTDQEKAQGYFTNINYGVKVQKLTIADGTAKVDFNQALENAVGGSCRVSAVRAQINETLKQFSTVKDVVISINGRIEDILQP